MSETSFGPFRVSYAYRTHGDLPGDMGAFYRDAGHAKVTFTEAHDAQIKPQEPARFHGRTDTGSVARTPIEPHPSYAEPHRRAPDENWFQALKVRSDGRVLSREEFRAARAHTDNHPRQDRNPHIRRR